MNHQREMELKSAREQLASGIGHQSPMERYRDGLLSECARRAHEANRVYCESLGDKSQPFWEFAPEWQRTSAINGAAHALEHPESGPEQSHECWMREKSENGWTWGPEKNPETKEHPCMVPYSELPAEQRTKDAIFQATVRATAQELRGRGGGYL